MRFSTLKTALLGTAALLSPSLANAQTFVGSWDVYHPDAPFWSDPQYEPTGPLAYTAQEAAALLFGGAPEDYAISTVGPDVATINNLAWYDQIGIGGDIFAEDYFNKYLGLYYGPSDNSIPGAASAFIRDNLEGAGAINYAFRLDSVVPEPATWAMMIAGVGMAGGALRRRKVKVTVRFA